MVDLKVLTAENLEKIRNKFHITHSEFANKLGINRTTLYLYESGKRVIPTELIYKLWQNMGIEPNEVFGIVKD